MPRILLLLVVALAAGTQATMCANDADYVSTGTGTYGMIVKTLAWALAPACCGGAVSVCGTERNVCANKATFVSAATVKMDGTTLMTCETVNLAWAQQRASAASDAAACDAVTGGNTASFKVTAWFAAPACCGGAGASALLATARIRGRLVYQPPATRALASSSGWQRSITLTLPPGRFATTPLGPQMCRPRARKRCAVTSWGWPAPAQRPAPLPHLCVCAASDIDPPATLASDASRPATSASYAAATRVLQVPAGGGAVLPMGWDDPLG
eukprot:scaffold119395_cov75-Phaeocystis_antarctica.AAC.1